MMHRAMIGQPLLPGLLITCLNDDFIRTRYVLIYFSITVKAATLIFISGRGSAIFNMLRKGNQVLFIIW